MTLPDRGRTLPFRLISPSTQVAVDVASRPNTSRLVEPLRSGLLDPELAALVSVLAEHGVSIVVAAPAESTSRGGPADRGHRPGQQPGRSGPASATAAGRLLRAASLGVGFAATIEASSSRTSSIGSAAAADLADDELSYLGVVVVLDRDGRVAAAHHVRPIALDGHGHVQRLGPAVLAARDATTSRLEHFAWGVIPELAARIRWKAGDLEVEIDRRRRGAQSRSRTPVVSETRRADRAKEPARPATIRELRASGWQSRTVKEELRANLLDRLASGRGIVSGIVGYDETVLPAIENAIVAGQDLVLLGERGQAKTRLARLLVGLLDECDAGRPRRRAERRPVRPDQPDRQGDRRRARRRDADRLAAARPPLRARSSRRPTSRSPT